MGAPVHELRLSLHAAAKALQPMCRACHTHFLLCLPCVDSWLASSPEAAIIVLRRVCSPSRPASVPSYSEVVNMYRRGVSDGWYTECAACKV
jgi:hypothetical protein